MIKLLIADDQALIRSGFRLILEAEEDLEVVGEAGDGEEAIRVVRTLDPDIVLMDIRMPKMDGVEATKRIVEQSRSKVLILTTFDLDEYLFSAVRAGASGFLLKDVPPEDLVAAIRVLAAGDALIEPRMTRRLLGEFAKIAEPPQTSGHEELIKELTPREIEVFKELSKGSSNSEIAGSLFISETTVKTHVAHLLMKLGARDRIQAVVMAYESGLISPGERSQQ